MELLFRDDTYLRDCTATVVSVTRAEDGTVRIGTDRSVFYATGGGQPGDVGEIRWPGGTMRIVDTVKGDGLDSVLLVGDGSEPPAVGATVDLVLDWERRYRHMRMHTALHLLCAVVPGSVTGGQIAADKSRLDFNVPAESLDKAEIEARINAHVAADLPVRAGSITDAELAANPDLVRTMSVKPPSGGGRVRTIEIVGVDYQPCGGTHVARTGEIGRVEVLKIENKGKQNRRVVIGLAEGGAP